SRPGTPSRAGARSPGSRPACRPSSRTSRSNDERHPDMADLLFELYCEELPASYLDRVIETLPAQVTTRLGDLRILGNPEVRVTGSPRRIAVSVRGVLNEQKSSAEELTGPPVKAAFDKHGKPT